MSNILSQKSPRRKQPLSTPGSRQDRAGASVSPALIHGRFVGLNASPSKAHLINKAWRLSPISRKPSSLTDRERLQRDLSSVTRGSGGASRRMNESLRGGGRRADEGVVEVGRRADEGRSMRRSASFDTMCDRYLNGEWPRYPSLQISTDCDTLSYPQPASLISATTAACSNHKNKLLAEGTEAAAKGDSCLAGGRCEAVSSSSVVRSDEVFTLPPPSHHSHPRVMSLTRPALPHRQPVSDCSTQTESEEELEREIKRDSVQTSTQQSTNLICDNSSLICNKISAAELNKENTAADNSTSQLSQQLVLAESSQQQLDRSASSSSSSSRCVGPAMRPSPHLVGRSSAEGFNQEIEKLIRNTGILTTCDKHGIKQSVMAAPDGHRAPLPCFSSSRRSVDTQTPSSYPWSGPHTPSGLQNILKDLSEEYLPVSGVESPYYRVSDVIGQSPGNEELDKEFNMAGEARCLSTDYDSVSPAPLVKFVKSCRDRPPPEGCEKIQVKMAAELPKSSDTTEHAGSVVTSPVKLSGFSRCVIPSERSAFLPLLKNYVQPNTSLFSSNSPNTSVQAV